jgi:hypothetical protein
VFDGPVTITRPDGTVEKAIFSKGEKLDSN